MSFELLPARLAPQLLSVLRIVTAFLFVQHGTAKYLGIPQIARFDSLTVMSLSGVAGLLELIGGALLLIGLFTRPAAFVMSGLMAFAYFIAHASRGMVLSPLINGGEPAVLFCFIFLYLSAVGGGPWSVDAARGRR
jgi:putative oxidoreductase